jgi:glyoxylase-like metal-dependent hydrolase (beta-lactamase superfamily II)
VLVKLLSEKGKKMAQEIITIPLKVPCYLIRCRGGFIMIDTGDSSDRLNLVKALDNAGIKPGDLKLVLLTHGDFDHAGNAAFLQKNYGVKVTMHADDSEMVKRGDQGWNRKAKPDRVTLFGNIIIFISSYIARSGKFDTFIPDLYVEDGYDLSEYGLDAKVIHLPGHSKGSIGILASSGDLFCGDLLMNMFKPDLHFMIDSSLDCDASVEKLKSLKIITVFPGHGKPFPMGPFIKNYRPIQHKPE